MSVRDNEKIIVVNDCLTGNIITTIEFGLYNRETIKTMLCDILLNDLENQNGIRISWGYKS